jgi:hypothetical protein
MLLQLYYYILYYKICGDPEPTNFCGEVEVCPEDIKWNSTVAMLQQ